MSCPFDFGINLHEFYRSIGPDTYIHGGIKNGGEYVITNCIFDRKIGEVYKEVFGFSVVTRCVERRDHNYELVRDVYFRRLSLEEETMHEVMSS